MLKSLCDYYDSLASRCLLTPDGYSVVKVHFAVCLNRAGEVVNIYDCRNEAEEPDKKDKTKTKIVKKPREEGFPKRLETTKIASNIIEHRPLYLFGLEPTKDKSGYEVTAKSANSHEDFVIVNAGFLADCADSPLAEAFKAFAEGWKPDEQINNPFLLKIVKDYKNSSFVFCLDEAQNEFLNNDSLIREAWEVRYKADNEDNTGDEVQCSVTGEKAVCARIHGKIKGLFGGAATGNILCSNKNPAECSYSCAQGLNSSMSESAMNQYVEALNYLLSNKKHRQHIDELTVVFWSPGIYDDDLFGCLFGDGGDSFDDAEAINNKLKKLMQDAYQSKLTEEQIAGLRNNDFYLIGLKPNVSRLSVKFFYRSNIADFMKNIAQHQRDLKIGKNFKPMSIGQLRYALKNVNSDKDTVHTSLLISLFKSIIYGSDYPAFLLEKVLGRVQAERSVSVNRAAIMKACINRKARLKNKQGEILKMDLDAANINSAYLCGRLFAVLEYIQQKAANDKLNRTIKDTYFTAAAVTPGFVFPKLIQLANHHLKVVERDKSESTSRYLNKLMGDIVAGLGEDGFPRRQNLHEQGIFYVGYFQQNAKMYEKKSENSKSEVNE